MCFALFGAFSHTVYASIADARGSYALSLALAGIFYLVSIFLVNFSCLGGKSLMEENRRMEGKIVIKQQFSEEILPNKHFTFSVSDSPAHNRHWPRASGSNACPEDTGAREPRGD